MPLQIDTWGNTYIVRSRDRNAVLERVPAHMQNFFVEVDLIRICLFPHPSSLTPGTSGRATGSRASFLARRSIGRARRRVDERWYADLLSLEGRFVGLQHNFHLLVRIGRVDREVVVVTSSHYIFCVTGENHFEFIEYTIVLIRVAQSRS